MLQPSYIIGSTRCEESFHNMSGFAYHQMCFETIEVPMFTYDLTTPLFALIDTTTTDPNVVTHSDRKGINGVDTL